MHFVHIKVPGKSKKLRTSVLLSCEEDPRDPIPSQNYIASSFLAINAFKFYIFLTDWRVIVNFNCLLAHKTTNCLWMFTFCI